MKFLAVKRCLEIKRDLKSVSRFNEKSVDAAKASWSRADRTLVTKMGEYPLAMWLLLVMIDLII
jgi:hypothetical protein